MVTSRSPNVRFGSKPAIGSLPVDVRGRDGCCQPPPAQIRTSPIRAYGSHLEYLTAKRCCLPYARKRL
jgi:hypothetical protein